MANKQLEPMLWLSDSRGQFIPRDFVNSFANWANVTWVDPTDRATLQAGPEHADYWEAWDRVLTYARVTDNSGNTFTVYQDGECWLIPIGMEWSDEQDCYVWPEDEMV